MYSVAKLLHAIRMCEYSGYDVCGGTVGGIIMRGVHDKVDIPLGIPYVIERRLRHAFVNTHNSYVGITVNDTKPMVYNKSMFDHTIKGGDDVRVIHKGFVSSHGNNFPALNAFAQRIFEHLCIQAVNDQNEIEFPIVLQIDDFCSMLYQFMVKCARSDFVIPHFTDHAKGKPKRYPVEYAVQNMNQYTDVVYVNKNNIMEQVPKTINYQLVPHIFKDNLLHVSVARSIDYNQYFVLFSNMLKVILNFAFKVNMVSGCIEKEDMMSIDMFFGRGLATPYLVITF